MASCQMSLWPGLEPITRQTDSSHESKPIGAASAPVVARLPGSGSRIRSPLAASRGDFRSSPTHLRHAFRDPLVFDRARLVRDDSCIVGYECATIFRTTAV